MSNKSFTIAFKTEDLFFNDLSEFKKKIMKFKNRTISN